MLQKLLSSAFFFFPEIVKVNKFSGKHFDLTCTVQAFIAKNWQKGEKLHSSLSGNGKDKITISGQLQHVNRVSLCFIR